MPHFPPGTHIRTMTGKTGRVIDYRQIQAGDGRFRDDPDARVVLLDPFLAHYASSTPVQVFNIEVIYSCDDLQEVRDGD